MQPGDKLEAWVLQPNGFEIRHRTLTVFSVGVVGGREHITGSDFVVYTRYPLLNLFSGEETFLYRPAPIPKEGEYPPRFDGWEIARSDRHRAPHPRTFKLAAEGLMPGQDSSKIEGYIHPGYVTSVFKDKGGHLWSGDPTRNSIRMYTEHPAEGGYGVEPQIRFIMPYIDYLAEDGEEVWWTECYRRDEADIKKRLTLCDHAVCKAIEESGLWGYYFPEGKARTDVDLAKAELQAVADSQCDYDTQKARIAKLTEELGESRKDAEEIAEKSREHQRNAGELKEANDELQAENARLTAENEAFRKRMNRPRGFDPLWSGR